MYVYTSKANIKIIKDEVRFASVFGLGHAWSIDKISSEWKKCTLIPIYKNNGDIQKCTNYQGNQLMNYFIKKKPYESHYELWDRVIDIV